MPYIKQPLLLAGNFVDKSRTLLPNYNFHHFDEWKDIEQATKYVQKKCYKQPWQNNDIFFIQVKADFSPVYTRVRDKYGKIVLSQQMTLVKQIGGELYFQDQIAFDSFEEGCYLIEFLAGDPVQVTLQSEWIEVRQEWEGTLLFRYYNDFNNEIFWEERGYMTFRIEGVITYENPISVRTVYLDQPGSGKVVKGDAARLFKLYVGQYGGIPNWAIDKLDEILDQNNLEIDGKPFAVNPGSNWNTKKIEQYPWAQWNIEMREGINRRSKIFTSQGLQERKFVEEVYVEGKLFGPTYGAANDNSYTINTIS